MKRGFNFMPIIKCLICGKERNADIYDIKIGKAKFCSQKCASKYLSKHPNDGNFKKGHKGFPKAIKALQQWIKINGAWGKGKRNLKISNEKHWNWKGDDVGYQGIHRWVYSNKGIPKKCKFCGKEYTTPKSIHWANIDHKYRRVLDDYISLCTSCHKLYDLKNGLIRTNQRNQFGQFIHTP